MDTDQGRENLRLGNHSNQSLHEIQPIGGPLEYFFRGQDTNSTIGGNPWKCFGLPGWLDTDQSWAHLLWGNHTNSSLEDTPPRGGTLRIFFFQGRGTNYLIGGNPW